MFLSSLWILIMVILLIKWPIVVMKFLIQNRSTQRAGSPGSWSNRSRIVRGIRSDREIVSWREITDPITLSQWSDRFWNWTQMSKYLIAPGHQLPLSWQQSETCFHKSCWFWWVLIMFLSLDRMSFKMAEDILKNTVVLPVLWWRH